MSRTLSRLAVGALALAASLGSPFTAHGAATATPTPSPTPPATVWGCFPGTTPNPCDGSLTTTYLSSTTLQPRRITKVETPPSNPNAPIDCFYVYPTVVSTTLNANAPHHITNEVASILKFQASRFSQDCKVYAPVYRQATLAGIASGLGGTTSKKDSSSPKSTAPFTLAYNDVAAAWHDYLANDNHGRGVVLIGHSQGSGLLIRLMHDEIDNNPAERNLLVSAIVPGGNLTVLKGQRAGGDLTNIPTCATGSETGCVIAYSTYDKQPALSSLFGRVNSTLRASTGLANNGNLEVACVNPAELSGDNGNDEALTPTGSFPGLIGLSLNLMYFELPPKASTPWVSPGERYSARCVQSNGAHVLMLKRRSIATVLPLASPTADWGLHLADLNLPLGNLIKLVKTQTTAYLAAHPAAG